MTVQLLATDRNLNWLGDPITGWTKLVCDLNFNAPASGSVELPALPEVMELLQPGNRLVVMRDGEIWCAGPMEEPQDYTWDLGENAGVGTVVVRFSDDLARIAGYITYPEPAKSFASQTTTSDRKRQIAASTTEEIIRTLVSENCGPTALSVRRIERLVLDTITGVGTAQLINTRFEPLLDACRRAAITRSLGFRTRQVGDEIRFGVYEPRDLTDVARFSDGLGNLRSVQSTLGAPTATSELVMGGNDPADDPPEGDPAYERVYVEVTSGQHADWWRVEKVIEKSGVDDDSEGELTEAGVLAFGNDNPTASLSTVTVDTPDLKAGRDFGLGDKVAVVLPTGLEISDVVQSIGLAAEPDSGELVTTVIGNNDKTTTTRMVWTVRDLAYRLGQLEGRG
ncbi:siphovirus ReqiPepy6 Gp37-like family protein [Streptomyces olivaceus]|uniref:siphovirus ReqiPepy6 Gp37-like family protein n=1 Tax=Streptomyces olivaceus TaxID=47716 RepID=UPI001CC99418|nr:siphovirus ReqiPepy6 Gp37-like family protein [Streptomyces olivaceus]MBZ6250396.1 siphovirus ReqiPepy6 Gp37-like family protein [Streptomyces olivaceus]